MAGRAPVGGEGRDRSRVRFVGRRRGCLPSPRRFRPVKRIRHVSAALLLIVAGAAGVSAEVRLPLPSVAKEFPTAGMRLDSPVHITADTLSYDEETGVAVADGNVELVLGNRMMRADRIRYDSGTGEADLSGEVRYKDAEEIGRASGRERVEISVGAGSLKKKTGHQNCSGDWSSVVYSYDLGPPGSDTTRGRGKRTCRGRFGTRMRKRSSRSTGSRSISNRRPGCCTTEPSSSAAKTTSSRAGRSRKRGRAPS